MRAFVVPLFALALLAPAAVPGIGPSPARAVSKPQVLDVVTYGGDYALVHFSTGLVLLTSAGEGQIAAEYGNPETVAHFAWTSGGVEIVVDVRSQAGESDAHFANRCAETVEAMKAKFPPDPPPTGG